MTNEKLPTITADESPKVDALIGVEMFKIPEIMNSKYASKKSAIKSPKIRVSIYLL